MEVDGAIEIRLVPHPVTVDRSEGKPRLEAGGHVPALSTEEVRDLIDEPRR
ncbi:MAG TPA: hypothetical protein VG253_18215 [Streptosporangiaceae bacterium]|nr:hypothetical protein [Streptosporangiaceae bacterium]